MPQKVRIALDAMGGDVGASVVIPGAAISLTRHPDAEFLLFGDRGAIDAQLAKHPALKAVSSVIHTDVAVSMHDKPSQALRRGRKNSSMWLAIEAVKKGEADVAVSAGNTGALAAMARFCLRMLPGHRPAGACGGMADHARRFRRARSRRHHRRRRAASRDTGGDGQRYGERAVRSDRPTVGLLNIGVEEIKGREEIREAAELLRSMNLSAARIISGSSRATALDAAWPT